MKTLLSLIAGLVLLVFVPALLAATTITYQGRLVQNGQPFTGTANLTFQVFNAPAGGSSQGSFIQLDDHPVESGLFQADLDFGEGVFDGSPRYLQIAVDGTPLEPRQAIRAAPLAIHALSGAGSSPWTISGSDINYLDGRVGVGRTPSDFFVIDSGLEQQDDDYGFGTGALRVMVREPGGSAGLTKFRVLGNGGVAIGNSYNSSGVPVDGLRVHGAAVFESPGRFNEGLTVGENGNLSVADLQAANPNNGDICYTELLPPSGPSIFRLGTCASSARHKNNIQPLDSAMELVRQLKPVSFDWSEDGRADIGLIAEDVADIEPRLTYYNSDGESEGVNYRHLTAVLVAAFQEQQAENADELAARDAEIAALRNELEAQRRDTAERLAALEALLTEGRQLAGGRQ